MTDYLGSVALPSMKQRQKKLCQVKMKARAEPVYNDSSNFGVRMLEKLGWSEGKGLGKREDGMSAPILPKMKQDSEGFGYAGEKDDHWTQHDQDFNQLLKSLNGGGAPEEEEGLDEVDLAKMKSLEEKSKNSRARVHYKKFTRGKDLSRASEKDLANIFGKKSLEEVKNVIVGEVVEPAEVEEEVEPLEERNILGLTTIKASVSVQDYFKKKMQEKLGVKAEAPVEMTPEEPERKKSKKSKRKQEPEPEIEQEPEPEVEQEPEELPKKKKKRSKNEEPDAEIVQEVAETPKKKSKKDKRKQIEDAQEIVQEQSSLEQLEEPVERKSKKGKRKASEDNEETATEIAEEAASLEQVEEHPKKKSKKKKRKQSQDEQSAEVEPEEVPEVPSTESKKSKKKKKATQDVEKEQQQQQNGTADDDDDEVTCRVKATD